MLTIAVVGAFILFFMAGVSNHSPDPSQPPPSVLRESRPNLNGTAIRESINDFIKQHNTTVSDADRRDISRWITTYAHREAIDPFLVVALINRESSFEKDAVSQTGAKGLGQIKPFNFDALHISDPFNIKENIRGTVRYLKQLHVMWQESSDTTRLVLASYYQGPNKTKKTKGQLPRHVENYVNDILTTYYRLRPTPPI